MNSPNLARRQAIPVVFTECGRISARAVQMTAILAVSALVPRTVEPIVRETTRAPHDDSRLNFTLGITLIISLTVFANLRGISALVGDDALESFAHLIRTRKQIK